MRALAPSRGLGRAEGRSAVGTGRGVPGEERAAAPRKGSGLADGAPSPTGARRGSVRCPGKAKGLPGTAPCVRDQAGSCG